MYQWQKLPFSINQKSVDSPYVVKRMRGVGCSSKGVAHSATRLTNNYQRIWFLWSQFYAKHHNQIWTILIFLFIVFPTGLFLRLQSRTAKDHTCHRSIESLAKYKARAFLNLSKMAAFQISKNPQSNDYQQITYTSGNVFLVDKVFMGTARVKSESILSRKSTQIQQIKYLKCRDEKDVEVLIPMSQPGEFIEALPSPVGNGRMSVNADSLIASQKFPIVVRFISGRNRPRLTSFSGLFTLLDSFEETTLFGCILDPHGFTMLELPVSSPLTFQLALNTHDLYSHPVVKKALRLCDAKGHAYFRELKYKFKFAQRILQISGRRIEPEDENDPGDPPSAANSAKFGVTTTYIYL